MSVRPAVFTDVPALAAIQKACFERSLYAGRATFDERGAKQFLVAAIQRHGHQTEGGTLALVSERDGSVEGFIIGVLDRIYPCLVELVATDFMFTFHPDAPPATADAMRMVRALVGWAEKNPRVIEVMLGAANTMGEDFERVGALYERCGLVRCGAMYQKGISR